MQLYFPEDWAAMLAGLQAWVASELPSPWRAVFGETDAPAPAKPYVWIEPLAGPTQDGDGDESIGLNLYGLAVKVSTVAALTAYTITVNGLDAIYISDASPTANEIRDGLIAAVVALAQPVAVSTVPTLDGFLRVERTGSVNKIPAISVGAGLKLKVIRSTESDANMTFQVDAMGRSQDAADPSAIVRWEGVPVIGRLEQRLEAEDAQEVLRAAGWAFLSVEGHRRPAQVAGSRWEDRSGFDLRLRCRMRTLVALDWIEEAPIDVSITGTLSA